MMKDRKKRLALGTSILIIMLAIVFIEGPLAEAGQPADKTFIAVPSREFQNIDPNKRGGGGEYMAYTFQTLVRPSGLDYHTQGVLAESWEIINPTTWKFTIRKGVKFHNGMPLTSADIQYSFYRTMGKYDPKFRGMNSGTWKRLIDKIETPDDYTVIIHTKNPDVSLLSIIRYLYTVPKAYVEKIGNAQFSKKSIGTGPFKIIEHKVGESMTLEAFSDYWNTDPEPGAWGPAKIKTVIYRIIPQEQTRLAALKTGEVHGAPISIDSSRALKNNSDISLYYTYRNQPLFILFNWRKEKDPKTGEPNPYYDVRVRKALNHAIDIEALIKNYGTSGQYRTTLLGKGGVGYNPNVPFYDHNPEKAKKLLTEAGYPNGFQTKFYVSESSPTYLEALLQYWRDLGIKIDLVKSTGSVVRTKMFKKQLDGMVQFVGGGGGYDPASTFFKTQIRSDGFYALHGKDEKVDELVARQMAEFDVKKRAEIIDEIIQILWKDAWFVPLWESVSILAVRSEWNYGHMPATTTIFLPGISTKK